MTNRLAGKIRRKRFVWPLARRGGLGLRLWIVWPLWVLVSLRGVNQLPMFGPCLSPARPRWMRRPSSNEGKPTSPQPSIRSATPNSLSLSYTQPSPEKERGNQAPGELQLSPNHLQRKEIKLSEEEGAPPAGKPSNTCSESLLNYQFNSKHTLVTLWSLGTLWVHSEETQRTLTFLGLCCNVLYDDYHDKKMIWNSESNVKKWCWLWWRRRWVFMEPPAAPVRQIVTFFQGRPGPNPLHWTTVMHSALLCTVNQTRQNNIKMLHFTDSNAVHGWTKIIFFRIITLQYDVLCVLNLRQHTD